MSEMSEGGYGKPPSATRFQKGQSGNPKGRPKGRYNRPPYDTILGQMVTIREDGVERRVTAAEAFLLHVAKRGLDGDGTAARSAMVAIEEARESSRGRDALGPGQMVVRFVRPGTLSGALEALRMGTKLDRFRPSARIMLEPWIVEVALARLEGRRLSRDEQRQVLRATRTPDKVRWPDWWELRSRSEASDGR